MRFLFLGAKRNLRMRSNCLQSLHFLTPCSLYVKLLSRRCILGLSLWLMIQNCYGRESETVMQVVCKATQNTPVAVQVGASVLGEGYGSLLWQNDIVHETCIVQSMSCFIHAHDLNLTDLLVGVGMRHCWWVLGQHQNPTPWITCGLYKGTQRF